MRQFVKDIVVEAGRMALDYRSRLGELKVEMKSIKDLVTEADRAIEVFVRAEISKRYPEHAVVGEEMVSKDGNEYCWYIDPIDGTTNFVHGQPLFGVSVGLAKAGEPIVGAVNLPVLGELYEAQKGAGAFCNGKRIKVSQRNRLTESVIATSVGCIGHGEETNNLNYLEAVRERIFSMRNFGASVVHLSYVACGRLDGYWQVSVNPYDIMAGILLVTEAGGRYSDFSGGMTNFYEQVLVTNGRIHDGMVKIIGNLQVNKM